MRGLVRWFYADLKAYRAEPSAQRRRELRARFERIFRRRTRFVMLDRPDVPLHTNGSENDIRSQVTRCKTSGETQSEAGRNCRDAILGLAKTCPKLGVSFWDDLGIDWEWPARPPYPRCQTSSDCAPPPERPGFYPGYRKGP